MPDLPSSSSFIPKRTAGTKVRQKRTRNFFLLSIVSYACLIAAPTASAAVYVYQIYTERQFDQVVIDLDDAISSFSEAEMARVLEFSARLEAAQSLVNNHVSLVRALESLEQTTAAEVGFTTLAFSRTPDGSIRVAADILATNFDAALFQRGAYKDENTEIANASLKDITFVPPSDAGAGERVAMTGLFDFTVSDIQFSPLSSESVPPLSSESSDTGTSSPDSLDIGDEGTDESAADTVIIDETI
jgi:hypothetical protein